MSYPVFGAENTKWKITCIILIFNKELFKSMLHVSSHILKSHY